MDDFFSVFPEQPLVTRFFRTLDLTFGGQQSNETTFLEPSMRRFFKSVCCLNEIQHAYTAADDADKPVMWRFFDQGLDHVRAYIQGRFPEQYDDWSRRNELEWKLERVFYSNATNWVFCIHCETRYKVGVGLRGRFCGFCGGWWYIESLKSVFIKGIDVDLDAEGAENSDGIVQVMKASLISYENEVLSRVPLILLPPRPAVHDRDCNFCHQDLDDDTMLVKGVACPPMHNDHFLHFRCSLAWFRQQVIENHVENPTCPAGHGCPLPFEDFLNHTDFRSLQHFWEISSNCRQVKFNRGRNENQE